MRNYKLIEDEVTGIHSVLKTVESQLISMLDSDTISAANAELLNIQLRDIRDRLAVLMIIVDNSR